MATQTPGQPQLSRTPAHLSRRVLPSFPSFSFSPSPSPSCIRISNSKTPPAPNRPSRRDSIQVQLHHLLTTLVLMTLVLLSLFGCSAEVPEPKPIAAPEETPILNLFSNTAVVSGTTGQVLHTTWFDFTVKNAYTAQEYGGQVPQDGCLFVVADIALESTFSQPVPMYDADFMLLWQEGFDSPLTAWTEDQFPQEYTLEPGESVEYEAVYQVPAEEADEDSLSLYFTEYFVDDSFGDEFCIALSLTQPAPEPKA